MTDITANRAHEALTALAEQLRHAGPYELVVIGGSGLLALGLIDRATRDVDVLAIRERSSLRRAEPLPRPIVEAAERVARDFALPDTWLNTGPSSLVDLGLPDGFEERLESRRYGPALTVHFASRVDQIHFKLYALVDQGPGKHEADLRALGATHAELIAAARWSCTHDPSPGYREMLERALAHMGVEDADLGS